MWSPLGSLHVYQLAKRVPNFTYVQQMTDLKTVNKVTSKYWQGKVTTGRLCKPNSSPKRGKTQQNWDETFFTSIQKQRKDRPLECT